MYEYKELQDKVEAAIKDIQLGGSPDALYAPIRYVLEMGGKRLRPVLTLMACDMYGSPIDYAMNAALCMEVFHNFTLLHDDLMDKADKRRNQTTVHKIWGDNTAILSGDAMLITAYKLMAKTLAKQLKELMELFTTTALEICEGQMFDMMFEQRESVTEAEYMEMIRLKTAVLLGCSLKTGAIVAQAPPADIQSLYNFGLYIGLAFQLQDDMLDVYGDPDVFGKNTGGDILCNKKTFPLIYALTHGDSKQQRELKRWLGMTDFNPEEKINSVLHIYNEVNVRDATQERISLYYRKAKEELSALTLRDERLTVLKNIADNLLQRNR